MDALSLDHLVIRVTDFSRSDDFYARVLGARVVARGAGRAYRLADGVQLNVHGPGVDVAPLARIPVAAGNSDLCFVWRGDIESALGHLAICGVAVELGPVARDGARGPGSSVYFRDPDGSLLEFIVYEGVAKSEDV
jgi:catechol 2,3-dioxygenase-like lactoylglutathione lyase family enzyme